MDTSGRAASAGSAGRHFLGIPLTQEARWTLEPRLRALDLPGRVVPAANWHLTLAFLGETQPGALASLRRELSATPLASVGEIVFGELGAFPRPARASVVWLGLEEGAAAITVLYEAVSAAAERAGFPREARRFTPHLTLSRLQPPSDVRPLLARAPRLQTAMVVDAVVLFRSHLGSGPARYEKVERYELAHGA